MNIQMSKCPVPGDMRESHPLFGSVKSSNTTSDDTLNMQQTQSKPNKADGDSKCPVPKNMRSSYPFFGGARTQSNDDAKNSTDIDNTSTTTTTTSAADTSTSTAVNSTTTTLQPTALDPNTSDNMMPPPNQCRSPGQSVDLPISRVRSSIPRGDFTPGHQENKYGTSDETSDKKDKAHTDSNDQQTNWVYPSEQMFFNAMKRKGWGPKEEDMPVVVSIHNAVNERAWGEVMKWENMHKDECDCPKLFKFMGRPKDLSPRARVNGLMGYKKPFDRHDWIVDRCGKKVRYIIDFYEGQKNKSNRGKQGFFLDTRPALDSFGAVVDRAKVWFHRNF